MSSSVLESTGKHLPNHDGEPTKKKRVLLGEEAKEGQEEGQEEEQEEEQDEEDEEVASASPRLVR